jgi:hypothetical protein
MYCKQCGHRSDEKIDTCPKCGVKLTSGVEFTKAKTPKVRWHVLVISAATAVMLFILVPRVFFRAELDFSGPTDKLRFLRALDRSQYKRVGQREFRLEGQTLIVIWDLRWGTLPEVKQLEIVRIVGRAWSVVGGENTRFRIEGDDATVAEYRDGEAISGAGVPAPEIR